MRALRAATAGVRALPHTLGARPLVPLPVQRVAGLRSWTAARAAAAEASRATEDRQDLRTPAGILMGGAPAAAGAAAAQQFDGVKPGDDDRTRFQLHWSVDMWKSFYPSNWLDNIDSPDKDVQDRIRAFTETLTGAVSTAGILGSTEAARYWAYHLTRSGFFAAQGVAALLGTRAVVGRDADSPAVNRFEALFRKGWSGPLTEALLMFYQDYECIKEGKYALPWDMAVGLRHRQFNPFYILQKAASFVSEATATLQRRDAGVPEQVWLKSGLLPDYYQTTFHYQTDGWMSPASAKVYETSTETLFVGRQDAMQRTTLVPLAEFMAGKDASQMQALEIAAGTGRFSTFVKDNWPSLQLTMSDLSPFYLAEARNNMQYWKRMRAPDAQLGPPGNAAGVTFLQTAAEKLDVPDNSQDVVYCVYLFHELPADVRRKAVQEMARVVKPGGLVVLTDSSQLGDREVYDATLGNFGDFNEPYYRDYISTPLGPLFEEAGLECGMKVVGSSTKCLSFYKPNEDDLFAQGGDASAAASAVAAEVAAEAQLEE